MTTATMTQFGKFDCQVCVPKDWSDGLVLAFAEDEFPCPTKGGWRIRHEGNPLLDGDPERIQCASRPSHVHIMLDA